MGTLRKLRKQGILPSQRIVPLRHEQVPFMRKMSEVILDFAQPLLENSTDEEFENIIIFTIISWNCSFLPLTERNEFFKKSLKDVYPHNPILCKELEKEFLMLLERKQTFFVQEKRMVMDYQIIEEKNDNRLIILSTFTK